MVRFITEKDYLNDLSRRARRYRIESSITQQELADATGISLRTIQNFENGKDIQMSSFLKILIALGLNEQSYDLIPDLENRPSAYYEQEYGSMKKRASRRKKKEMRRFVWGDEL